MGGRREGYASGSNGDDDDGGAEPLLEHQLLWRVSLSLSHTHTRTGTHTYTHTHTLTQS